MSVLTIRKRKSPMSTQFVLVDVGHIQEGDIIREAGVTGEVHSIRPTTFDDRQRTIRYGNSKLVVARPGETIYRQV